LERTASQTRPLVRLLIAFNPKKETPLGGERKGRGGKEKTGGGWRDQKKEKTKWTRRGRGAILKKYVYLGDLSSGRLGEKFKEIRGKTRKQKSKRQ